jgi:hypothetical protein
MCLLLLLGSMTVMGPWAGRRALMIAGVALLMWWHPPVVSLPRLWWALAGFFLIAAAGAFLPAAWFEMPDWRGRLDELGIQTDAMVVIQSRHAAEWLGLFAIMLIAGLWFAGHRPTPAQARTWALAFVLGVAVHAVFAKLMQPPPPAGKPDAVAHFGFFSNRNHTATYLAMGSICGLGCTLQALRDKRFASMAVALAATGICLWAVLGWSASRGGLLLVLCGSLVWLALLGRRYLGPNGRWAVGLIMLTTTGLFFIWDSQVKERVSETIRDAEKAIQPADLLAEDAEKPPMNDLDFRIPTALDTLDLIGDFKWTGIGAGQFHQIFPQYRRLSSSANNADHRHPESDWLWMAAETGIPATLALAGLVVVAFGFAFRSVLRGRERALRSGCLCAALLLPAHGLFDIPGHHIALAWSSVFLFTLALRQPSRPAEHEPPARPCKWPFRVVALAMLAVAIFLARAQWWGGPQPAITTASTALAEARSHYQDALAAGRDNDLPAALPSMTTGKISPDQHLEMAMQVLDEAALVVPLNREVLNYRAFLAMHSSERLEQADVLFAAARALDPSWVDGPLQQARMWAPLDPRRSAPLLQEALNRASALDRIKPGTPWSEQATRHRIEHLARVNPDLEKFLPTLESPTNRQYAE